MFVSSTHIFWPTAKYNLAIHIGNIHSMQKTIDITVMRIGAYVLFSNDTFDDILFTRESIHLFHQIFIRRRFKELWFLICWTARIHGYHWYFACFALWLWIAEIVPLDAGVLVAKIKRIGRIDVHHGKDITHIMTGLDKMCANQFLGIPYLIISISNERDMNGMCVWCLHELSHHL